MGTQFRSERDVYFVAPTSRVFYPLHGGVEVTGKFFTVHAVRYDVAGLTNLHFSTLPYGQPRRILAGFLVADAVIALVIAAAGHSAFTIVAAIGCLIFGGAVLRIAVRRMPAPLALVGTYYGHRRVLLVSRDHRAFHEVCRALQRAHERRSR